MSRHCLLPSRRQESNKATSNASTGTDARLKALQCGRAKLPDTFAHEELVHLVAATSCTGTCCGTRVTSGHWGTTAACTAQEKGTDTALQQCGQDSCWC